VPLAWTQMEVVAIHLAKLPLSQDDAGNVIETHEHAGDFKAW